ncbi:unnamed protein product [Lampetra planeri]
MACSQLSVQLMSWALGVGGVAYLLHQQRHRTKYGRYQAAETALPARLAWFLQELPSFLVPVLLLLGAGGADTLPLPNALLLLMFCGHYFQRTFVFSLLSNGRPTPLAIVAYAFAFCSYNGFLQGHQLVHCAAYPPWWHRDPRFIAGVLLFALGMGINIHSDSILRGLRRPGQTHYSIPQGGLFELVSGANFLGEIVEWSGFALASWSLPAATFCIFTVCAIGPRAVHHHQFYLEKFKDYPKSRRALIPFLL